MKIRRSFLGAFILCSSSWCMLGFAAGAPDSGSQAAAQPATSPLSDGQVLAIYIQANTFDIETGRLGEARGASDEVRSLGRMVVADHTAVRDKASQLGMSQGITPSLPPGRASASAEHESKVATLQSLTGVAFDREYLQQEIRFHSDAIQAVRTVLIPATSNAELKQLMTEILPGFQHHLDETVRVAKKLGYE